MATEPSASVRPYSTMPSEARSVVQLKVKLRGGHVGLHDREV